MPNPINQSDDIYKAAVDILDTVELQQPVRLLGVRLTNLKYNDAQLPLFPQERRKALMVRAMDAVNNRYGDDTATLAPATSRMLSSPSTNNIFSLCTGETAAPIEKKMTYRSCVILILRLTIINIQHLFLEDAR